MPDDRLQQLKDRNDIGDLLHSYCLTLDRMQLDELAALFTEDCSVAFGADPLLQSNGSAALARSLQRMWRWKRTSHHLSNIVISFEGPDAADVVSYVMAWHEDPNGQTATVFGQYRDRVVRTDVGWRIASRRMLMNGNDAGFTLDLFPAERKPPPRDWTAPVFAKRP